jgi:hypothetical protein
MSFFFIAKNAQAQSSIVNKQHNYWLSLGLGKAEFPSAMVALGFEPKHKSAIITARYSVSGEIAQPVEPGIKINELGVLYGIKLGKFRFSTGLSTVWGNERGVYLYTDPDPLWGTGANYQYLGYTTIGIPGEIRFITSAKHVGIGITGFGNLNERRSFIGVNLALYVGKMKFTSLPSD